MVVEVVILWVIIGVNATITVWNLWTAKQYWVASDQLEELVKAVSVESKRRVAAGDLITWYHLFDELNKVRHSQHVFALATFRDPYKLYPPYIRRLVGK